jgi:hypothetical protein
MMALGGIARTVVILVHSKERGASRCSASAATSDAAVHQKRHRPEGVAHRAIMAISSNIFVL